MTNKAMQFERIENLFLLENGLEHISFELARKKPSFFRVAKEAHLVLYRSMVEALRGTANISITGIPKDKKRMVQYKLGNKPWQQIEKINIDGCQKAWKYSKPIEINAPPQLGEPFDISEMPNFLQSFYELLAKIQAECFMSQYVDSKPIQMPAKDIVLLEWLHEQVRNEFEHFIPKLYSVSIESLIYSSVVCLQLSGKLLFESRNVRFHFDCSAIKNLIENSIKFLRAFSI